MPSSVDAGPRLPPGPIAERSGEAVSEAVQLGGARFEGMGPGVASCGLPARQRNCGRAQDAAEWVQRAPQSRWTTHFQFFNQIATLQRSQQLRDVLGRLRKRQLLQTWNFDVPLSHTWLERGRRMPRHCHWPLAC